MKTTSRRAMSERMAAFVIFAIVAAVFAVPALVAVLVARMLGA